MSVGPTCTIGPAVKPSRCCAKRIPSVPASPKLVATEIPQTVALGLAVDSKKYAMPLIACTW